MNPVIIHSSQRASDQVLVLWAISSAQYPKENTNILNVATRQMMEAISQFSLNARRALETTPKSKKFDLTQSRWNWEPTGEHELVKDFRFAANRIIHAKSLRVGFEQVPASLAVIVDGAVVIPYVEATTEDRKAAMIDPFAFAHAYLYQVAPYLDDLVTRGGIENVH